MGLFDKFKKRDRLLIHSTSPTTLSFHKMPKEPFLQYDDVGIGMLISPLEASKNELRKGKKKDVKNFDSAIITRLYPKNFNLGISFVAIRNCKITPEEIIFFTRKFFEETFKKPENLAKKIKEDLEKVKNEKDKNPDKPYKIFVYKDIVGYPENDDFYILFRNCKENLTSNDIDNFSKEMLEEIIKNSKEIAEELNKVKK